MKKNLGLNSNILIIILLTALVCIGVYSAFFKTSCGCKESFNNPIVLEIYTAPWCGYCKDFEKGGTIDKIKSQLGAENVKHYVEGESETAAKMSQRNVGGFPTIMVTQADTIKATHTGERTVAGVCDFYNSQQ
tara:strand:+ start:2644 stop:3042 length:399 start_codon:yes stop_codon:yes gene_type:complete